MKITIEIADRQANLIADWASINRTLSQALHLLERIGTDEANDCGQEISDLMPAIHNLQMAVRSAVWAAQSDRSEARKQNRL